MHAAVLGAALVLVRADSAPPETLRIPSLVVVAPEAREDLSEAAEPLAPQALPDTEAAPLPEVTLEPDLPAPAEDPAAAPAAPQGPPAHLSLVGRRVRAPAPPPSAPIAPSPEPATMTPAAASAPLRLLSQPDPTYPAGLRWQGEVTLRVLLLVREDGRVGQVVVESATGLPALDAHVSAFLARTWRFAPLDAPRWVRQGFRIPAPS